MAVLDTDLLMIERSGTLYKTPVSGLPSGGGGADPGLVLLQQEVITTAVGAVDFDLPDGYSNFRMHCFDLNINRLAFQVSTDGSTFLATNYAMRSETVKMGATGTGTTAENSNSLNRMVLGAGNIPSGSAFVDFAVGDDFITGVLHGSSYEFIFSADAYFGFYGYGFRIMSDRPAALRVLPKFGSVNSGTFFLYGYKESV